MIEYNFLQDNNWRPYFSTSNKYSMLWQLSWIETWYIKEIVAQLEAIREKERESYDFWSGESTYIECYAKWDKPYSWKVFISYDWGKKQLEVPFEDIYNLMKDWKEYIEEWEKEQK